MPRKFNLVLSDEAMPFLNRLQARTEDSDLSVLFRNALRAYDLLTEELMRGGQIFSHRKDGSQVEIKVLAD